MLLFSLVHAEHSMPNEKNQTQIKILTINIPFYSTKSTFFNLIKVQC